MVSKTISSSGFKSFFLGFLGFVISSITSFIFVVVVLIVFFIILGPSTIFLKMQNILIVKKNFYNHFFHLRPGTYDININRYNVKISDYKINEMSLIFTKKDYYIPEKPQKEYEL